MNPENIESLINSIRTNKKSLNDEKSTLLKYNNIIAQYFAKEEYKKKVSEDSSLLNVVIRVNCLILPGLKVDLNLLKKFYIPYLLEKKAQDYRTDLSDSIKALFNKLNEVYNNDSNIFVQISKSFNKFEFSNSKSYALYFAYLSKNYDEIEDILNTHSIRFDFKTDRYLDIVEFSMLHFYRGLIFLSNSNFFNASLAFISCLRYKVDKSILNSFQLESIRRLFLLSNIVNSNLRKIINEELNNLKNIKNVRPLAIYEEFNKLLTNKNTGYKNLTDFFKSNKSYFLEHKTKGLVKIILKKTACSRILETLKLYKRIKIDKLSQILDMDKEIVMLELKNLNFSNKVNTKFDELKGIIEVFDFNNDQNKVIGELKETYENINKIEKEMVEYSIEKNFSQNFHDEYLLLMNADRYSPDRIEVDTD